MVQIVRHLPIEGTHNFRDAGGYPTADGRSVRWRTLFRSDSLHAITPAGIDQLTELCIRTTVDLRAHHEIETRPWILTSEAIKYAHLPLSVTGTDVRAPQADNLLELNMMFLELGQRPLRDIMAALAEPAAWPAVVGCAVGKDRTGLIVALLQELAGVSPDDIVRDYVLTGDLAQQLIEQLTLLAVESGRDPSQMGRLMAVDAQVMHDTLSYLDQTYGGAESYLRRIGLTGAQIEAVRSALVEG